VGGTNYLAGDARLKSVESTVYLAFFTTHGYLQSRGLAMNPAGQFMQQNARVCICMCVLNCVFLCA